MECKVPTLYHFKIAVTFSFQSLISKKAQIKKATIYNKSITFNFLKVGVCTDMIIK